MMKERISDTLDRLIAQARDEGRKALRFDITPEGWEELLRQADEQGGALSSDTAASRAYRGIPLDVKELPEGRIVAMIYGDGN